MILIDTSIWADHFRDFDQSVADILLDRAVVSHPFVVGELALGNLRDRARVLADLNALPLVMPARHSDVMRMIEIDALHGAGIGYVDAHLLASCRLTPGTLLWTRDKRLARVAERMSLVTPIA